jgi:hypothetical protein
MERIMQHHFSKVALSLALASSATLAQSAILITEVNSAGSAGTSGYAADWFEIYNTGPSAVDLSGWKIDDDTGSFSSAVTLRNFSNGSTLGSAIPAGGIMILLEGNTAGTNDGTIKTNFINAWFGANAPAGLLFGAYGGSGVGLSASGDAVNLFDAGGALQAKVTFGAASAGRTFDNGAGLNNATLSTASVVGVNGAFTSFSAVEIGSPGVVTPVPEAGEVSMLIAGLGLLGAITRRRAKAL